MSIDIVVSPPPDLARLFADEVARLAHRKQVDRRSLALALPGGSVAETFLPVLAEAPLEWSLVECFWCDERAVPPDHPESNFRVAADLLLNRVPIDQARVHRMRAEVDDLNAAAADYEAELMAVLGDPARFDVILLGVGPDGHVCSLFPGHPALDESYRRVIAVTDSPKPPQRRLTLTLPALADAFIVIAAFGASKAPVIREALKNPDSHLPVSRAARVAQRALFLLDEDAAGRA